MLIREEERNASRTERDNYRDICVSWCPLAEFFSFYSHPSYEKRREKLKERRVGRVVGHLAYESSCIRMTLPYQLSLSLSLHRFE